jgi:hypothetical protein
MFLAVRTSVALRTLAVSVVVLLSAAGCVTAQGQSPTASPVASQAGGVPAVDLSGAPSEAPAPGGASSTSPAAASSAPFAVPSGAVEIAETAKGQTLTVAVGTTIKVTLHSTYWTVAQGSPADVLALVAPPVYSAAGAVACVPGSGCGTVIATFRALAPGRATITATRTSCGEAMQCIGGNGAFDVTVIVQP